MMPNFDSSSQHKLSIFNNFLRQFFLILFPPFESLTPHITIVDMLAHSRRIVSKTDALQGNAYTKTSWLWCLQLSKLQKILKSSACGCVSSNLACCHTCQASQIWHQLSAHENKILVQNCLQNKWILPRLHIQDQAIILYEWGGYNIIQGTRHQIEKC